MYSKIGRNTEGYFFGITSLVLVYVIPNSSEKCNLEFRLYPTHKRIGI